MKTTDWQWVKSTNLTVAAAGTPKHSEIARRAFEIYVQDGRRQGQCAQNRRQAEQDLLKQVAEGCESTQCSEAAPCETAQLQGRRPMHNL